MSEAASNKDYPSVIPGGERVGELPRCVVSALASKADGIGTVAVRIPDRSTADTQAPR